LGHFGYFQGVALKNSSVALLPNIPPKIQHEPDKFGFLFFVKGMQQSSPPGTNSV
jgi:hypothetical protein